jgi:hypothetical protein
MTALQGVCVANILVNTYILNIETQRPNTNRHDHAHKCMHCAGIEPVTSCIIGEYSHNYAKLAIKKKCQHCCQCLLSLIAIVLKVSKLLSYIENRMVERSYRAENSKT